MVRPDSIVELTLTVLFSSTASSSSSAAAAASAFRFSLSRLPSFFFAMAPTVRLGVAVRESAMTRVGGAKRALIEPFFHLNSRAQTFMYGTVTGGGMRLGRHRAASHALAL